jgi:predicted nucleic acid-binding protein
VVTEAAWLLRHRLDWIEALLSAIQQGLIELCVLDANDLSGVRDRMKQYESLNPQFADACLVHLAEREGIDTIFTLDRRDFSVYRTKRGKPFRLLPEAS